MIDSVEDRYARQEAKLDRLAEQMLAGFERVREELSGVRAAIAHIEGRLDNMPTAWHFGAIEGRLDEMSRHLNSALVHVAPPPKRGRAG
ncbi:MAG: hypothetical protein HQL37_07685 [Alphaproteobacteria bacterium]|nr:hypothetical protein [Alphaproteobacteria bacterium]